MSFKSSKGRDTGKELEVWRSTSSGQGVGGGGGGGSDTPFSASGGTKSEPGDGFIYHVFGHPNSDNFEVSSANPPGS